MDCGSESKVRVEMRHWQKCDTTASLGRWHCNFNTNLLLLIQQ